LKKQFFPGRDLRKGIKFPLETLHLGPQIEAFTLVKYIRWVRVTATIVGVVKAITPPNHPMIEEGRVGAARRHTDQRRRWAVAANCHNRRQRISAGRSRHFSLDASIPPKGNHIAI
jgi:hypothetical protein